MAFVRDKVLLKLISWVVIFQRPLGALQAARGTLFPWIPFLIGCGIAVWFSLPWEPGLVAYVVLFSICMLSFLLWHLGPEIVHPLFIICMCFSLGALACGLRLWVVAAPVLDFRYYGPITGRVVDIDRSQSDALRITLDQVWLKRVPAAKTPERVRVSLRSRESGHSPFPGEIVMLTGHLLAPQGPVEPRVFDFRRMAFFAQIGAVGYSTTPVVLWQPSAPSARLIDRLRSYFSASMMAYMPSQAGAFATGAMTGDRSWIRQETAQALRDSSLAHLLAISGMNLAFLIAFVFALIRYGLALVPFIALRVNTKKIAAIASFFVAVFYLALSGSNVATERAFIMVSVMLGAVMLDRKALTLRSIALAGIAILLWKPESLLGPGFQMSFAATAALIAGFREVDYRLSGARLPRWVIPVFTLFLSSLIGGLSTAPYAAAHFNRYAVYGLVANLLTGPVMGIVVMPAGAIAAILAPLGLAQPALWLMEKGSAWILYVAHWVAGWNGSVLSIPTPVPWVLALITFAGTWFILWRGWVRFIALFPAILAAFLWTMGERPLILISERGDLAGVLGPEGRALSAPKGAGFVAKNWLENDGDLVTQEIASYRAGMEGEIGMRRFEANGVTGIILKGKKSVVRLSEACDLADFVVVSARVRSPRPKGCLILDQEVLTRTGSLALYPTAEGVLEMVPTQRYRRLWTGTKDLSGIPLHIISKGRKDFVFAEEALGR